MVRYIVYNGFMRNFVILKIYQVCNLRTARCSYFLPPSVGDLKQLYKKTIFKRPLQIVLLKGIFSGLGSIIIGLCIGERLTVLWSIIPVLLVGFIAYGLSIYFYVYAQRLLGAARTSAYYAISPFIAAILSLIIFKQIPTITYFIALIFMVIGAWLSSNDNKN